MNMRHLYKRADSATDQYAAASFPTIEEGLKAQRARQVALPVGPTRGSDMTRMPDKRTTTPGQQRAWWDARKQQQREVLGNQYDTGIAGHTMWSRDEYIDHQMNQGYNRWRWDPQYAGKYISDGYRRGRQMANDISGRDWRTLGLSRSVDPELFQAQINEKRPSDPVAAAQHDNYIQGLLDQTRNTTGHAQDASNATEAVAWSAIPIVRSREAQQRAVNDFNKSMRETGQQDNYLNTAVQAANTGMDTLATIAATGAAGSGIAKVVASRAPAAQLLTNYDLLSWQGKVLNGLNNFFQAGVQAAPVIMPATAGTAVLANGAANTVDAANGGQDSETSRALRQGSQLAADTYNTYINYALPTAAYAANAPATASNNFLTRAFQQTFPFVQSAAAQRLANVAQIGPAGEQARQNAQDTAQNLIATGAQVTGGGDNANREQRQMTRNIQQFVGVPRLYQQGAELRGQVGDAKYSQLTLQDCRARFDQQLKGMDPNSAQYKQLEKTRPYYVMQYAVTNGHLTPQLLDSQEYKSLTPQQQNDIMAKYTKAHFIAKTRQQNGTFDAIGKLVKANGQRPQDVADQMLRTDPQYKWAVGTFFYNASPQQVVHFSSQMSSGNKSQMARLGKLKILEHCQDDGQYGAKVAMYVQQHGKTPLDPATVKGLLESVQKRGVDSWFRDMSTDTFLKFGKMLTSPQGSKIMKQFPQEFQKRITQKFSTGAQTVALQKWKNNIDLTHQFVALWFRSKGMHGMADFAQNPVAFYGSLAVLAIGGTALVGGLFGDDDDEDEQGDDLLDDDAAYRKRIRNLYRGQ